jgi:hypothetical protein
LVEVAALNLYDLVVVLWGFFEWFWAELFWKTTVIVADWSWDSHRDVQLWIKHLMSWDRWMVSHYDTIIWTSWFNSEFDYPTNVFWIVMAVIVGVPLGIVSSPVWVPLGLLALIGWGIYELIAWIVDESTYSDYYSNRVDIYDYQLKVKYQEENDYEYVKNDPSRLWRIYDDYTVPAKILLDDSELEAAERSADADLADRLLKWAQFSGNRDDISAED